MDWVKDYVDSDTHPQMLRAGYHGRQIFRFLCRLSGRHELAGKLPADYLASDFLVSQMGMKCCPGCTVPAVTHASDGVQCLVTVGLLSVTDDGQFFVINGWTRRQSATTNAKRQKRFRDSKRALLSVTSPLRPSVTRNALEEKRREEKRVDKKKHTDLSASADPPVLLVEPFRVLWNEIAVPVGLPGWATDAHSREKAAKLRLREKPDLEYWRSVIERIALSSFCRGGGKDKWVASPDFLVQPDTHVKVLEGKYDDRAPKRLDAFAFRPPDPPRKSFEEIMAQVEEEKARQAQ